jgi:hypothetical protein
MRPLTGADVVAEVLIDITESEVLTNRKSVIAESDVAPPPLDDDDEELPTPCPLGMMVWPSDRTITKAATNANRIMMLRFMVILYWYCCRNVI